MDLFELLFIALFLLFPILEQVLRRKKPDGGPARPGPTPSDSRPGEVDPRPEDREPVKASEMVPDDLWAVLTGEQRQPEGVGTADEPAEVPAGTRPEPWSAEPEESAPAWEERAAQEESGPAPPPSEWQLDDEIEVREPVSLEYRGPEAYSLERLDQKAVSLEANVPSEEARHRRFHEITDGIAVPRRTRRSPVGRALRSPDSLRQAFVLSEVLGTPKGLE